MKRTVRKEIKLNRDEWERICENTQKSKKKIGTYIREAAVCGIIKAIPHKAQNFPVIYKNVAAIL